MISCCEYFTVLAPPGFTWAGVASSQMKQRVTTARLNLRTNLAFETLCILFLLNRICSLPRPWEQPETDSREWLKPERSPDHCQNRKGQTERDESTIEVWNL